MGKAKIISSSCIKKGSRRSANIKHTNTTDRRIIFTVGHSTRDIDDFISLMKEYGVNYVVDIRTIPRSKHNPQFNSDYLKNALAKTSISYENIKELGGLRKPNKDSINTFWKNNSFKGFADYMQTEDFKEGLDHLIDVSAKRTIAIMCAEILPWRCHRSLIADALTAKRFTVKHIIDHNGILEHKTNKHTAKHLGSLIYK
ncbi:DUF488 domain-containing protein [Candidatus Parvarchaeota archaeon]|uniref:DUF488 domain-containing protein n=1 Tax=Candidatus Acidifodinimicrobium mancum TaxID=2898728 RepID=A0A8T3UVZ0_9ARCH|nr:DUF488 domain-containing protein [Candidatus Acidifodinimicrobium mancum]MBE5728509.1 DUF488 domain-containing protein [Candidatus Acidifodinimicrobium mancum]MBE5728832.1 DUF488 domain-containing protein [Candidatus Acidifodinimicrobium mancum]MBE5730044.1 DUF488 domain-containing protein [Candidatus Acidifodinimicrobium mancum]